MQFIVCIGLKKKKVHKKQIFRNWSRNKHTLMILDKTWTLFPFDFTQIPVNKPSVDFKSTHSTVIAILKKSEAIVKNTTAASKYILRRPRISINWNPPFQISLHKNSKEILFRLTKSFFQEQLLFSFLGIVKQKKISKQFKNFWNFSFFGIY